MANCLLFVLATLLRCALVSHRSQAAAGGRVTLVWETQAPYESTVVVANGARVTLSGIDIRHDSPSVANNFAVHVYDGAEVQLADCTVSSASGAGVCVEGATCELRWDGWRCSVALR